MPELVAELVGELAPVAGADIDDDPRRLRRILVQPDRRRPRAVIVDAQCLGLLVGKEPHPGKRRLTHPREDAGDRRRGPPHSPFTSRDAESRPRGGVCARRMTVAAGNHSSETPASARKLRRLIISAPTWQRTTSTKSIPSTRSLRHRREEGPSPPGRRQGCPGKVEGQLLPPNFAPATALLPSLPPAGGRGQGEGGRHRFRVTAHLTLPDAGAPGPLPLRPEGRREALIEHG